MAQSKIGWRPYVNLSITSSSLWNSIYSVYNADAIGSSSLNTSLFSAYNGESNTNDSKGTNNGTAQGGLTYTTGKIGNAFSFNGTNAYVTLSTSACNFGTNSMSLSLWFYPNSGNVLQSLIHKGLTWANIPGFSLLLDNRYNSNQRGITFGLGDGYDFETISTVGSYTTTSWNHLICTWDVVSKTVKIYINGLETAYTQSSIGGTGFSGISSFDNNGFNVQIGRYETSYYFNGKIDELNFWSKKLTATEITELYNSGNGVQYIGDNFYKPTTNDALLVNNGTAVGGLTYEVGKVGTAFKFNGTNAYVQLGDVMDVGTSSWSYSMWFNASQLTAGYALFSKSMAAQGTGRVWASVSNNKIQFNFSTAPSYPADIYTESTTTINTNTWYHVVFILDRNDKLKMYINGSLETITTPGTIVSNNLIPFSSVNYNNNNPFRIGAYTSADNTTPTALFNGSIDAFNVWNRVISQTEITELYNSGNGKQYVSSLDSDAQAFIASAAITVTTQQTAINTLVTDLKAANIWTKMKAIYPFVGGTPAQHRFNLKSPGTTAADFYLDFIGGGIHNANGYQTNGTTAYADTKLIPFNNLTLGSFHHSVYSRTTWSAIGIMGGCNDSSTPQRYLLMSNSNGTTLGNIIFNTSGFPFATPINNTRGLMMGNRTSTTTVNAWKDGVKVFIDSLNSVTERPTIKYYIGARNNESVASGYDNKEYAFYTIGDGLTDTESANFYTAVQKFQTTLGRQV